METAPPPTIDSSTTPSVSKSAGWSFWKGINPQDNLVRLILACFGIFIFADFVRDLTFYGTKLSDTVLGVVIGYVAAIAKDIYGYYFGGASQPAKQP